MTMILLKSHNKGFTKKNGTVVRPFDDKRYPAKLKQSSLFGNYGKPSAGGKLSAPQLGLFGSKAPGAGSTGYSTSWLKPEPKHYENATNHPKPSGDGKAVQINEPTAASAPDTWTDPHAVAVFVPGGPAPAELNGIALAPWTDHPRTDEDWDYVEGQMDDLDEPPLHLPVGLKGASGCVIEEPDGRVWLVSPTNAFGGYDTTYPKGKLEDDLSMQANAIKEAFEESGLKVEITGFLGDFKRTTSVTRLYTAKRVGGSPVAVGWESQAVRLVPRAMLHEVADHHFDAPINNVLTL